MKLTNGEIFNAKAPLGELMGERFPVKVSYQLAKLAAKLNEQLQIIERVRQGLIQTYGKADTDNPTMTRVSPECEGWQKFNEEIGELFSQEVEIVFDIVTLPDTLEVEPSTLMALDKFIRVE